MRGNNQLQCDTQLSDNSIPETASSRQSDVIKSRGYLIHVPHVRTRRSHTSVEGVHAREIDTRKVGIHGRTTRGWNRRFESRRIPNHQRWMCLCARGKRAEGGGVSKPRNRFRVTSQMSIYLVISFEVSNREEKWRGDE